MDLGFEINKKKHFVLRKSGGIVIADHGVTFNHKANYIYKTHTVCEGYSIRKFYWLQTLKKFPEISAQIKQRIIKSYFFGIQLKMMRAKKKKVTRLKRRNDI